MILFLSEFYPILNSSKRNKILPKELEDVYDAETFNKSVSYKVEYEKFGIITATFSFLLILIMLVFHGFAFADRFVRSISENPILFFAFFRGLFFLSDILGIHLIFYGTFVIEEKYGFNKTTPFTYLTDKMKGYLLGALIGGGLLALFIWFYYKTGQTFWIYIWLIFTAFSHFYVNVLFKHYCSYF